MLKHDFERIYNKIVEQQLHAIANEIIAYAKQLPNPLIVMEDLNGMRDNFDKSKELNKRFHS